MLGSIVVYDLKLKKTIFKSSKFSRLPIYCLKILLLSKHTFVSSDVF